MINAFIVAVSALVCATLGIELNQLFLWPVSQSLIAGVAAFLMLAQIHGTVARVLQKKRFIAEINGLREADRAVKTELEETRRKVADVTMAIAKKSDANERKVVGELQMLEGLIREFATSIAGRAKYEEGGEPQAHAPSALKNYAEAIADPEMLEIIRRSLEENRVDLYLQPTVSLPQRKVRFYEALSRLRSGDGTVIMPAQYIKVAAPAGLMSVVDNLLLFRCVQIVRRLTIRRKDIGVFCNISGHTLNDSEFFPQFLDFMYHNRDLTSQIVFEFTQASVMEAGPQEEANLRYLSGLGFPLSMDQVTNLNLDFTKLKAMGFHYLKVRADTLLTNLQGTQAAVRSEDLKEHMARAGINLIVERIEDEKTVVQLLEYNVDFGQGYLFGEPKPIREMGDAAPREHEMKALMGNVSYLSPGLARRLAS